MSIRDGFRDRTDEKRSDIDSWMAGSGGTIATAVVIVIGLAMLFTLVSGMLS